MSNSVRITLKIGRHSYLIDDEDVFMDNGHVVLLLTQSRERMDWGRRPSPRLSKRAIKEISVFSRVPRDNCEFTLAAPGVDADEA